MPLRSALTSPAKQSLPVPGTKTLGLIAGMGELPGAVASEARKKGYTVVAIALNPPANESFKHQVDHFHKVHIGRFGEIIKILKKFSVCKVVMAGKVPKNLLFQQKKSIVPDLRALKVLFSLPDWSDTSFLQAVTHELRREGIELLKTTSFTGDNLTPRGVLTKKKPGKSQWSDIRFGWRIAKGIGRLDIGQAIVVKGMAVMAVEALEGTDEAILRGGGLAGKDAVVIKVSKPQQDMRLDVPVAGIDTLKAMKKVQANVLALEAGKSIIVEKDRFLREADTMGITVVGVTGEEMDVLNAGPGKER